MSHFDRNQTRYLAGGGSVLGGITGRHTEGKKAKKDAVNKYGLKKGTLEYDEYVRRRKDRGFIKGSAIGAGVGFGASKGVDAVRGKIISDKARVKGTDLGKDYLRLGKGFRGVKSEADIDKVKDNWKEIGSYAKYIKDMLT